MPEDLRHFTGGTMTKELFTALLDHAENEKLDFKREPYRLDNDVLKSKLIKDIASIANTNPPNKPGYILIGVKARNQGGTQKRELHGVSEHPDDAALQSLVRDKINPPPNFLYYPFEFENKSFGVLEIHAMAELHQCRRNFGDLADGQYYTRKGSQNAVATTADLDALRRQRNVVFKTDEQVPASPFAVISRMVPILEAELREQTYFRYRDEKVEAIDSSAVSRALASRYDCKPVCIGDQVFPVAILWQNRENLIHPDQILGIFDYSTTDKLTSSATLNTTEYASAREFIKSKYTAGPIKYEGLEYCMTAIDLTGSLPRVDGRFGWYYDNILTQYAMEWELKKALKENDPDSLARWQVGALPLRDAVELGRNPLVDGTKRCTAMTVSMLMVFERPEQGLWTLIQRRSKAVGLSAGMLHVVPAGMFEVKNKHERWSVEAAVWREMLEEVYSEPEQHGDGVPSFEDHLRRKEPLLFLSQLLKEGRAEFSLTGICCDLLNLRPEICTVLFVRDAGLTEIRAMNVNWEYEKQGPAGTFGTPWSRIESDMQKVRVGEIVPSGVACFELGRMWLRQCHGL